MGQDITGLSQNVGTEWDLQMVVNGQLVNELGLLEQRERKVHCNLIETMPSNNNGITVSRATWHGFTFTYSYVRQDDSFDDIVDALIQNYQSQGSIPIFTGQETVINNGVASQWQYLGGTLVGDGLGNIKGADKTDGVTFSVRWSSRYKIRGGSNAPNLSSTAGL